MVGGQTNISRLKILFLIGIVTLFSCSGTYAYNGPLAQGRQSFLFIEKTLILHQCGKQCLEHTARSMASGFVIKTTNEGSYGVTAGHVCTVDVPSTSPPIQYKERYLATTLQGDKYKMTVLATDMKNDICLFFVQELAEIPVIRLSRAAPKPGDKAYTIGAPRGIFSPPMVPMFDGIYNGDLGASAFYSLPAQPGSSGSMILNEKGELIGILHSVYIKFPHIVLAVKHESLTNFIKQNIIKFEIYRKVKDILGLEDVFSEKEDKIFHINEKKSKKKKIILSK